MMRAERVMLASPSVRRKKATVLAAEPEEDCFTRGGFVPVDHIVFDALPFERLGVEKLPTVFGIFALHLDKPEFRLDDLAPVTTETPVVGVGEFDAGKPLPCLGRQDLLFSRSRKLRLVV